MSGTRFTHNRIVYRIFGTTVWVISNSNVDASSGIIDPSGFFLDLSGNNSGGVLTIPSTVPDSSGNTYNVVAIANYLGFPDYFVFNNHKFLTAVNIPNSITNVSFAAFQLCTNLTSVTFYGSGLIDFGWGVFQGCTRLSGITIPPTVRKFAGFVFAGCTSLTSINIPESVTQLGFDATVDGQGIFQGCTGLTSVTFSGNSSLFRIWAHSFNGCTSLPTITIPDSVTSITGVDTSGNASTFKGCTNLTNVSLSTALAFIPVNAFQNCTKLPSIIIPSSVTSIGNNAFNGCTLLNGISIPGTVLTIGEAFWSCTSFTNIIIPNTVTSIAGAFNSCTNLTSVTVPNNLKNIGANMFNNCTLLSNITFTDASSSSGINIPSSVTLISSNAFEGCRFSSITIPNSVTEFGTRIFYNCTNLTNVSLSTTISFIPTDAFRNCTNLPTITIPDNVISIYTNAFAGCNALSSVTFLGKDIPIISTTGNFASATKDTAYCRYDVEQDANYNALSSFFTTVSTTPCFKSDSKILTDKGYVPIQDLKKGDLVKTLNNGFVPVNMIGKKEIYNPASKDRVPDQLYTCDSPQYPEVFEPLVITGLHAILVDDFKQGQREYTLELFGNIYVTDNKYRLPACADNRTTVYEVAGYHTIYHLLLDNSNDGFNYGIYANGLLVESISERSFQQHFTCN